MEDGVRGELATCTHRFMSNIIEPHIEADKSVIDDVCTFSISNNPW